jgi:hypothetical protein
MTCGHDGSGTTDFGIGSTPETPDSADHPVRAQAAERLGVSWLTLSRWENGRTRPKSVNHVRALTAMLNDAQAGMVAGGTPF